VSGLRREPLARGLWRSAPSHDPDQRAAWNREHPGSAEVLPGSLEKDRVENHVHDEICFDIPNAKMSSLRRKFPPTVSITLQRGQEILTTDWYACYLKMTDGKKPCN